MSGAESALPALADVRVQHVAEGMQRGIAQGIEQKRTRGLARVRRQAAIKLGGAWRRWCGAARPRRGVVLNRYKGHRRTAGLAYAV